MPTLSASDYTSFIKAQAASQAYRNGAVPIPIQTRDQPFATQSVLNAQLLTSQAAYVVNPSKILVETIGTTVSTARNNILSAAVGNGTIITYTSSIAHGLTDGQTITITGFLTVTGVNLTGVVTVTGATSFTIPSAVSGTATGTGSITGYVYYTTASPHNFTTSSATQNLSVSGLTTAAFNLTLVNVALVPSSTIFVIANSATGTAVTGASGILTVTRFPNTSTSIINNARVLPYDGVGRVNNPKSLVTLTQSGTLSSGKTQQLGGLPTTAPKGSGVYAPIPQLARVDTKATGGYRAVRSPV